jgi:Amt family ammonium transporter
VHQLWAQVVGSFIMTASVLILGFALMYGVKLTKTLRISEEGELEGIDIHEHGAPAYHPEYGFMGVAGVGSGSTGGAGTSAPAGVMVSRTPVG